MFAFKKNTNTTLVNKQTGQSMTQYLILTFMLAVGSLITVGHASKAGRHQVAAVSHEVAGDHAGSIRNTAAAKQSSGYASANASLPYSMGGSTPSNPVTNPTDDTNTSPADPGDTPPSTDPNNPVTNPGDNTGNPGDNTGNPGDNTGNPGDNTGNPGDNTGNPDDNTGNPGDNTGVNDDDILPPPLCTATTPEEDDGSTKTDEDKGFWGSLWDEVKDGLVAGYEFVKGFWEGMKKQVADLGELLANPIETAQGLIELGKQFVKEPAKTAKMIADSLGEEFSTLVHCGAFDKGRVIGENVSPAFMVKLATKMAKLGDLSKALTATKKDFGCASFAADTAIWTPDGRVNVASLIKGNTVLSRNEKDYEDEPQSITNTFGRTADHYYRLTTEFETISVTAEHPMWKQGRGWTEAQYLKVDDVVASADGDVLILDNKKIDKPLQVYNFSVDNTPSYFAGESKLWVHNAKCDIDDLLDNRNKDWPSIDKDRLYNGTSTDRGTLRNRIKAEYENLAQVGFAWQAHHIIPWELRTHSLVKRLNIDMNSLDNAIPLPCKASSGSACSIHSGYHSYYSEAMKNQLKKIESMDITDAAKKDLVEKSITKAREALTSGNPPLRNKDGASITDWDNVFKDI